MKGLLSLFIIADRLFGFGCCKYPPSLALGSGYYFSIKRLVAHFFASWWGLSSGASMPQGALCSACVRFHLPLVSLPDNAQAKVQVPTAHGAENGIMNLFMTCDLAAVTFVGGMLLRGAGC